MFIGSMLKIDLIKEDLIGPGHVSSDTCNGSGGTLYGG